MFETLKVLSKSITYNGKQIVLATCLVIIVIYIYSLYAYNFVLDTFWIDTPEGGENQCTSVRHCFFAIFSLGPRATGGIGDVIVRQSYLPGNKTKYYSRYIFDLSMFVVVNMMGLNIIFGIIIQTFAQLRDMLNVKTNNQLNICFVCSLHRNEIEKTIEGYVYHIIKDHNIWHYLFFMYHLRRKPAMEYSGVESYVARKITKDDVTWFPFGRCMKLVGIDKEEDTREKVEELCANLHNLALANRKTNPGGVSRIEKKEHLDIS